MSTRPSAPMVQSSHHARRETGGLPVCSPGSCPALAFRCRAIASNSASTDKRTPPNALLGLIKIQVFPGCPCSWFGRWVLSDRLRPLARRKALFPIQPCAIEDDGFPDGRAHGPILPAINVYVHGRVSGWLEFSFLTVFSDVEHSRFEQSLILFGVFKFPNRVFVRPLRHRFRVAPFAVLDELSEFSFCHCSRGSLDWR